MAALGSELFVAGGKDSSGTRLHDVWKSSDGVTWTQATAAAPWTPRYGHAMAAFGGKLWIVGGNVGVTFLQEQSAQVWSSADGITWVLETTAPFYPVAYHVLLVHNSRLWTIAGAQRRPPSGTSTGFVRSNEVWSSPDGIAWTQHSPTGPIFPPRSDLAGAVFDGTLWIMGGDDGALPDLASNDVWSSPDGIAWTQVNGNPSWSPRRGHSGHSTTGRIWIAGGGNADVSAYSTDGSYWVRQLASDQTAAQDQLEVRHELHGGASFQSKPWISGGYRFVTTQSKQLSNDVWYFVEAARTLKARWGIHAAVGRTRQLRWKVEVDAVGKTSQIRWNVLTAVGDSNRLLWHIGGVTGATRKFRWLLPGPVYRVLKLRYKISPLAVGRTAKVLWHVRQSTGRTARVRWEAGPKCGAPIPFTVSGTSGTKVKTAGSTVTICSE